MKFIRLAFCDVYGKQKTSPSCPASFSGHSLTAWPLTPRPLPALAERSALIFFSTPILPPSSPALAAGERPGGAHVL